jgi:hypothetical protein
MAEEDKPCFENNHHLTISYVYVMNALPFDGFNYLLLSALGVVE